MDEGVVQKQGGALAALELLVDKVLNSNKKCKIEPLCVMMKPYQIYRELNLISCRSLVRSSFSILNPDNRFSSESLKSARVSLSLPTSSFNEIEGKL